MYPFHYFFIITQATAISMKEQQWWNAAKLVHAMNISPVMPKFGQSGKMPKFSLKYIQNSRIQNVT